MEISVTPSNATLLLGQNLTIHCTTWHNDEEVFLRINNEIVTVATNPRLLFIDPSGSNMVVKDLLYTSVTREDNGLVLTCNVKTFSVYLATPQIILRVQCK